MPSYRNACREFLHQVKGCQPSDSPKDHKTLQGWSQIFGKHCFKTLSKIVEGTDLINWGWLGLLHTIQHEEMCWKFPDRLNWLVSLNYPAQYSIRPECGFLDRNILFARCRYLSSFSENLHAWYMSILVQHCTFGACKNYAKQCINLRQNHQNWPKWAKILQFSLLKSTPKGAKIEQHFAFSLQKTIPVMT